MWNAGDNLVCGICSDLLKCYIRKNEADHSASFLFCFRLAVGTHLSEALAAEHGTVSLGLEGNLGLAAATCAGSGEELTGATSSVLASITASLAALGLILEAAFSVEFLFTSSENEFVTALFALQSLVSIHDFFTSLIVLSYPQQSETGLGSPDH